MSDVWKVGETVRTEVEWDLDGAPVTTGTFLARYHRPTATAREYLQADLSTWAATVHNHALTLDGTVWAKNFIVPASAAGHTVTEEVEHRLPGDLDDPDWPGSSAEHDVVVNTVDDLAAVATPPDVAFGTPTAPEP